MGIKQILTKVFLRYLKSLGLVFIRKDRWNHDLYDYPEGHRNGKLLRPVAVRTNLQGYPYNAYTYQSTRCWRIKERI